jgi:peroxiredoxin
MKKIWIVFMAAAIFACQPKQKESFTINGSISGLDNGKVYLQDRVDGLMVNVDSAEVQNGNFSFSGELKHPEIFYLNIDGVASRLTLFVENTDIEVDIDAENPSQYQVSGSKSHEIFTGLDEVVQPFDERLRFDQEEIQKAVEENNEILADQLQERYEETERLRKQAVLDYVNQYSDQPAAVFIAIRQLSHGLDHEELQEILDIFDTELSGSRYYDDLAGRVADLERVSIGKPAIDFTLPYPEGNEISLPDYRGKYVLLSFWASWCPYCRAENPDLVKAYNEIDSEDFEIIGVSLDRTHEAWVKGIEEDGLTWPQVSDLEGWRSEPAGKYVVRSIPQNILIGPDGTIVARNLKYNELTELIPRLLQSV